MFLLLSKYTYTQRLTTHNSWITDIKFLKDKQVHFVLSYTEWEKLAYFLKKRQVSIIVSKTMWKFVV